MTLSVAKWKRLAAAIIAALLALTHIQPASAAEPAVIGIEFEQAGDVYLYVEQDSKQLRVFAEYSGQTAKADVTSDAYWVSSQPSIIKVEKGLLTPLKKGTAQISAKYAGKTITLTATADYLFKSLELSPSEKLHLDLGTEFRVDAIAIDHDDDAYTVSDQAAWSSSNTKAVTVDKGLLTPVGKGKATITAKYKGLSASIAVEVSSPYQSMKIEYADDLELLVGQTPVELTAIAVSESGHEEDVTEKAQWTTSNSSVAAIEQGRLTAKGQGTAKITASYLGVSYTETVIVRLPYQALRLKPGKDLSFFIHDAPALLTAEVLNDIDKGQDVSSLGTWTSSNPVAVSLNVAPEGAYVAPRSAGSSIIRFEHRGLSKELRATVYPTVTGIKADTEQLELFKNETVKLPVITGTTLAGDVIDLSGLAEWTSSNPAVAEVKDGKLKAVSPGDAVLTAAVRHMRVTVNVKVHEKVLILIPDTNAIGLVIGNEAAFPKVRAVFEDGTEVEDISGRIEWKSSSAHLLVREDGMKALLKGRATLSGTYLNAKVSISVSMEPEIERFVITPAQIELNPGRSKMIQVRGIYKDGSNVSLSSKMQWTSSNSNIVTVNRSTARAVNEGTAVLTAEYQGKKLIVTIQVVPKLKKLTADTRSLTLKPGASAKVSLTALYDTGKEKNVTADAKWTSTNSSVAAVDAKGNIRAGKKGLATVKATFGNKTVTIRVRVQ